MAFVSRDAQFEAAIIAGRSHQMDEAANRGLMAVRAAAAPHAKTHDYIRSLSVVAVPGERGRGRQVTDRLIVSTDPGAAAIEWGHLVRVAGARRVQWVPGQHPMRTGMRTM